MSTSTTNPASSMAQNVRVTDEILTAELTDGREISVPLSWFPRLTHATPPERDNWRLIGSGEGIRWDDLDEDISIQSLLAGRRSGESAESLNRWLAGRR